VTSGFVRFPKMSGACEKRARGRRTRAVRRAFAEVGEVEVRCCAVAVCGGVAVAVAVCGGVAVAVAVCGAVAGFS
jgi:hypothetical protein